MQHKNEWNYIKIEKYLKSKNFEYLTNEFVGWMGETPKYIYTALIQAQQRVERVISARDVMFPQLNCRKSTKAPKFIETLTLDSRIPEKSAIHTNYWSRNDDLHITNKKNQQICISEQEQTRSKRIDTSNPRKKIQKKIRLPKDERTAIPDAQSMDL